jgi:PAS domain S-box-containing protein
VENELLRVVDALPGLVLTALPDGCVDFQNGRWRDYTGQSADEVIGRGWQASVHAEDLPSLLECWRSTAASGEPGEIDARLRRVDGAERWFLFRAASFGSASGQGVKLSVSITDIDDRKRAVEDLYAREAHYQSIADTIPALIAFMSPAGELEIVNRRVLDYFGKTLEDLKRWSNTEAVHPDDLPEVIAVWRRSVSTGAPYEIEHRMRRFDGVYRWFHVRALPVRDAEGRVTRWCCLQTDIDDRKRAEALRAGERRLLEMIATGSCSSASLVELCSLAREVCTSCVSCSILLRDCEADGFRRAASSGVPEALAGSIDEFTSRFLGAKVGESGKPTNQIITVDIASDPKCAELRTSASMNGLRTFRSSPIVSPQGHVLGILAIFAGEPGEPCGDDQEVIARIAHLASIAIDREQSQWSLTRTLEELKQSEGKLRTIIDASPGFVWSTAPDGSVDFLNRGWLEFTGAKLDDARGAGWQAALHPDDAARLLEYWQSLLKSGRPGETEARLRRLDGTYRWFLMRAAPFRDEAGQIVKWFGQNTDIDDRKQAESLLEGEKRLLEMMAGGGSMSEILEALCQLVEGSGSGCYCSVVVADSSGARLEHGAAPSLPIDFITSTIGQPVAVHSGPCAMAVYLNEQVVSTDLASETRWGADWREMALALGLRACWATPISSAAGRIMGAFAIYYDKPGSSTALHRSLIDRFTHIARIAVQRARADSALKQSEARKTAILDSALDCIVTIDHEGCITDFNPAAERTFGHRRDDVLGVRLGDLIVPALLREAHRRGFDRHLATGETRLLGRRVELAAMRADGSEFPVELAISRIPLDGPPSFTGYLRDITERKLAEDKLRRSEASLAAAQRLSLTGSFYWRVKKREIAWSEQLYRIFEFDLDTPITLELIASRVHPEDLPMLLDMVQRAEREVAEFEYEHRVCAPGAPIKYVHLVAHRARDLGESDEYMGTVQDITERRRSAEALAASERNLSVIINTMPGMASSARPDGYLAFLSQTYLDYLGVSAEQVSRLRWDYAVHPDDVNSLVRMRQSASTSHAVGEAEARLRRFDGSYRWFLCRNIPLRDESGAVIKWFGVNIDIEDRKRADEELRIAQAKLSQIGRILTMSQLTASIAHEVNQPLSGIITNASTCLRMLAANPPNVDGALETARRTIRDGNRASEVIKRLRALFSGKAPNVELFDINEAALEVVALSLSGLKANGGVLRQEFGDGLAKVYGDRVQLQQVILNMLQNASDAMCCVDDRPREIVIRTEPDENECVRLTVQDVGPGFDPHVAQRLFDPFYTTKADGMGIGLAISRSIIERHGGRMWAALNEGPGATFAFTIPLSPNNTKGAGDVAVLSALGAAQHQSTRGIR